MSFLPQAAVYLMKIPAVITALLSYRVRKQRMELVCVWSRDVLIEHKLPQKAVSSEQRKKILTWALVNYNKVKLELHIFKRIRFST